MRPTTRMNWLPRGPVSNSGQNGCHTCRRSGTPESSGSSSRNARGITPITVVGSSLTRICRPTIDGSPPNRRVKRSHPSRIDCGAPGRPSSSRNVRPNALSAPRSGKEIGRDERRAELLRIAVAGERDRAARPDAADLRERRRPLADVAEVGTRERSARIAEPDECQPVGVAIRQRLDQHRVDDAEDGGVGADAEREGEKNDRGEATRLADAAPRVAKIEQQAQRLNPRSSHLT